MRWNDVDREARLEQATAAQGAVSSLADDALGRLLDGAQDGWGHASRAALGEYSLFVKAIPVTHRELDDGLTTANIYGIPTYLNYPFGSPGVGVGRELAFARRTTDWVQSGTQAGFPVLLHDRVIDRRLIPGDRPAIGYSAYRHENAAMNSYLADRASADSSLVLVYEDVGTNAKDWLLDHPADAPWILDDVRSTLTFLRKHRVVHFDVDLFNVITDGRHAYIADHGLVMDSSAELSDDERQFLAMHNDFDVCNLIMSLGHQLYWSYDALPVDDRTLVARLLDIEGADFNITFVRLFDELLQTSVGPLDIDPNLRSTLNRFRDVIDAMHEFFSSSQANWSQTTKFDSLRLARLLDEADSLGSVTRRHLD